MVSRAPETNEVPFPLSYVIVAVMSILAAWMVSVLIGLLIPTWRSGAYLLGAAAAVFAGVLFREAIARERPNAELLAALRARELILLVGLSIPAALILRYLPWHPLQLVDMLLNIWFDPQDYVDGRDLVTILLLLGAWAYPLRPLDTLEKLAVQPSDLPPPKPKSLYEDSTAVRYGLPDLTLLHRKLSGWALTTLTILIIALGIFWHSMTTAMHALTGAAIIAYAAGAFILLALGNYQLRRSRWLIEGVEAEGETEEQWAALGGVTSGLLAVAAVIVPAALLLLVVRAVLSALLFLLLRFMALFKMPAPQGLGGSVRAPVLPQLPFVPPPPAPSPSHGNGDVPDWLIAVLAGFAFFIVGLLVLFLAQRWRQGRGGPRMQWLKWFKALGVLLELFSSLTLSIRRWLANLRASVAQLVEQLSRVPKTVAAKARGPRGSAGGTGAEQVRYWYGQMVRAGNRSGLIRRAGQTPIEYRAAIREQVVEAHQALDELTTAYVEARYSGREVPLERGAQAQQHFRHVRQAMTGWVRRLRRREGERGPTA